MSPLFLLFLVVGVRCHFEEQCPQFGTDCASHHQWSVTDWWQSNINEDDHLRKPQLSAKYRQQHNYSQNSGDRIVQHYRAKLVRTKPHAKRPLSPAVDDNNGEDLHTAESNRQEKKSQKSPLTDPNAILVRPKPFEERFVPKSNITLVRELFTDYFTSIRHGMQNHPGYMTLKRNLRQKFMELGLETAIQGFWPNIPQRNDKGHNIIGIYPGKFRNTPLDSIIVIGAHFDTVSRSPGVEDNGSGSATVLEMARLLQKHHCKLNTTIIFVLFDMEEDGLIGSKHFVKNYLFPAEIEKKGIPVKGAIVVDMLLEYDSNHNSQYVNGIGNLLPEWTDRVRRNRYRADFAAVWARRDIDSTLFNTLAENWLNRRKYKLFLMDVPLPKLGYQLTTGLKNQKLKPYQTFLRSDHSSFWYPHSSKNETINAILLTDLGPWRRKVSRKYHSAADNAKLLNRGNLQFLCNSIDSILKTVIDMSDGHCRP